MNVLKNGSKDYVDLLPKCCNSGMAGEGLHVLNV